MDLIYKQDVSGLKICQDRCQITRAFDSRAGRDMDIDPKLICNNARKACLAQAWRAIKEDMVKRLAAALGRPHKNSEILLDLILSYEFCEPLRPEISVRLLFRASIAGYDPLFEFHKSSS